MPPRTKPNAKKKTVIPVPKVPGKPKKSHQYIKIAKELSRPTGPIKRNRTEQKRTSPPTSLSTKYGDHTNFSRFTHTGLVFNWGDLTVWDAFYPELGLRVRLNVYKNPGRKRKSSIKQLETLCTNQLVPQIYEKLCFQAKKCQYIIIVKQTNIDFIPTLNGKISLVCGESDPSFRVVSYIGSGCYGDVYGLSDGNVLKLEFYSSKEIPPNDISMQSIFAKRGLAPMVDKFNSFKVGRTSLRGYAIVMHKVNGTVYDLIKTQRDITYLRMILDKVEKLLKGFAKYNLYHGDFHWDNIGWSGKPGGIDGDIELLALDFGCAEVKIGGRTTEELGHLAEFTFEDSSHLPEIHAENRKILLKLLEDCI